MITYSKQGDYYLPDLELPEDGETRPIGIYGRRHLEYIKEYRRIHCTNLLTSGRLHSYLADIDEQAQELFDLLVEKMAEHEGVTEAMKAADQMEWVGIMNNIRNRAQKIVNNKIVYR